VTVAQYNETSDASIRVSEFGLSSKNKKNKKNKKQNKKKLEELSEWI
jgi:hypothetical protein